MAHIPGDVVDMTSFYSMKEYLLYFFINLCTALCHWLKILWPPFCQGANMVPTSHFIQNLPNTKNIEKSDFCKSQIKGNTKSPFFQYIAMVYPI